MKKIAVVGIGAIGSIVGGGLTLGGQDVTLVCTSWRDNLDHMRKHGLTVLRPDGVAATAKVKALFIDEATQLPAPIDILIIATKSNETDGCLTALKPYLAPDAMVVSMQNGMNEDLIIPAVGREHVVPCVSYTGGILLGPGYVRAHGGSLVIGELDGRVTPRCRELAQILSLVAPTAISEDIMRSRWDKLAQVTTTVPVGAIAGVGFPAILQLERAHPLLARLMCETLAVAREAGHLLDEVAGLTGADWHRLAAGPAPGLSRIISAPFAPQPGAPAPDPDASPLLKDIRLGLPLEIEHTNGYVIRKGRELGVSTPTHDLVVGLLRAMEKGQVQPGLEHLNELLRQTAALAGEGD